MAKETADLWGRIGKILPLLSSDKTGDVVNTALAIDRILKKEGKTWADLAERVKDSSPWDDDGYAKPNGESPGYKRPEWAKEEQPKSRPFSDGARRRPSAWKQDKEDVEKAHNEMQMGRRRLDEWSQDFLASVYEWTVDQSRPLTDRQRDKLNEILDKLGL